MVVPVLDRTFNLPVVSALWYGWQIPRDEEAAPIPHGCPEIHGQSKKGKSCLVHQLIASSVTPLCHVLFPKEAQKLILV